MKRKATVLLSILALAASAVSAQDYYASQRAGWLRKADAAKPVLNVSVKSPVRMVELKNNPSAYQGWEAVRAGSVDELYSMSLKKNSGIIVDFGEHLTGEFSCSLRLINDLTSEAPVRLRLTFVEVPGELGVPFEPYPGGLSSAWIQQEVVTIDHIPGSFTIPRRLSFRYVKIDVMGSSFYDFGIADMKMAATTSAGTPPAPLADNVPQIIRDIDRVGIATLKECMQTVYEDGPKRDRRLWIGDLYLEALANTYSFENHELTKRCLYFLAALAAESGFLHATVFEEPEPHPQYGQHIIDYALLWNTSLLDYLKTTGDMETALDLWPVAVKQTRVAKEYIGEDYLYNGKPIWIFSDWRDGYDPTTAMIGMMVKTFKDTHELGRMLGKESEVADLMPYAQNLTKAARKHLYDSKTGIAYAGADRQVSYLSQAWLALGDVLTKKEAQKALRTVMADKNAVYPGSPYGNHFLVEAMMHCDMTGEARDYLVEYWGGMVTKGADTFWEVYDPNNDTLSPYQFYPINSYCHAWSCTPVYFIRKYPEVFQK